MVSNNETIILGGLIREVERTLKNRVPGLSYIPLLGNLFTSSERQREKIDLMVFLTPRIIETPKQATEATIEVTTGRDGFSLGEEATIRHSYNQFKEANKNQGFSRDLLHQDVVSADVISGDIKTGDLDSLLWPEKSPRDDGKSDKGKAASGAEPKEPDPKDSLPGYRKRGGN
jgi:general secretion pathway protein D